MTGIRLTQGLNVSKAGNLAALEKDLNFRQEQLLANAREEMDAIHKAATAAKIAAMTQADAAVQSDVDQLTEQVKQIGEQEVERRMNSTTTTGPPPGSLSCRCGFGLQPPPRLRRHDVALGLGTTARACSFSLRIRERGEV